MYRISYLVLIIVFNLNGIYSNWGTRQIIPPNNGIALLPPMGWSSWQAFGCKSCDNLYDKTNCLSEAAIQMTAQQLVNQGFANSGYEYIILDDCWQSPTRDDRSRLYPAQDRFPNGISYLARYVHDRRLKLGIFSDLGYRAASNNPGSAGFHQIDANTFASWDIDYVKMSAFTANPRFVEEDYKNFGHALQRTNRPMLYAVSWPVFREGARLPVNYQAVSTYSNTWRFAEDALPNWECILRIMDTYSSKQKSLTQVVHPRSWNDADLLLIGVRGITLDQGKAQMAVWAIMASPLIFSVDIRTLTPEAKAVLQNREVIAIDQDKLGIPGYKYGTTRSGNIDIWIRQISPIVPGSYSYAVAFVHRNQYGSVIPFDIKLEDLNLNYKAGYFVTNLFPNSMSYSYRGTLLYPSSTLQMRINPSGVALFKLEAAKYATGLLTDPNYDIPAINNNEIIRYNI